MSLEIQNSAVEQEAPSTDEVRPDYHNWLQIIDLFKQATERDQHLMLLNMLMTADERDALIARVNILNELLKGNLSQRQISQMLRVGVATITRGSNELKNQSQQQRNTLAELLALSINSGSNDALS